MKTLVKPGLAEHHQIHGVQPVLPVPDVAAAADGFVRVLGFELDFFYGDAPHEHGRVKAGQMGAAGWGEQVYIHLSRDSGDIHPCGETRLHVGHDIDGLHAHALAQGAVVLHAPRDEPWGLREMTLQTPGGHVLVLGAELPRAAAEGPAA